MLQTAHLAGIAATVGLLLVASLWSGRRVKDEKTFIAGGRNGSWMVCGAILGTLVGGQSTIGTAQLAFCFGLSAWWFTLGAALGALLLAVVYAAPIRRSDCTTLLEIVARQYGRRAETAGSLLFLIGIFISIVAQVLSSSAMLAGLLGIPRLWAALLSAGLIALFVSFGGIQSAGAGGIVKLALLYVSCVAAGTVVWRLGGGWSGILESIGAAGQWRTPDPGAADPAQYARLTARGPLKDIGGCLSLSLGVVTTQTYASGIWSAASTPKARKGALLCALLIPLIGAACTLMGMYMRGHYATAAECEALRAAGRQLPTGVGVIASSAEAFPAFVLNHIPPWLGGIAVGAMLVNVMGCGSGLALGAATILVRDVYGNLGALLPRRRPCGGGMPRLLQIRLTIAGLLAAAAAAALAVEGAFINDLGFLSLGLRAVALLFPLSIALFCPRWGRGRYAVASMTAGTAAMLLAKALDLPADALYYGLAASAAVLLLPARRPAPCSGPQAPLGSR